MTTGQVVARLKDAAGADLADLADAVEALVPRLDGRLLGARLRDARRRRFGGRYLDIVGTSAGANRWAAFDAATGRPAAPAGPAAADPPGGGCGGRGAPPPAGFAAHPRDAIDALFA